MTRLPCQLFIDECLSEAIVEDYILHHIEVLQLTAEVTHYRSKFGPHSKWKDQEFVEELARHPNWIVLSGDRGKNGPAIQSLPLACRQHRVSLLCLSSSIMERGPAYQGPQILAHWDRLITLHQPRGTHAKIQLSGSGKHSVLVVAECPTGFSLSHGVCVPTAKGGS